MALLERVVPLNLERHAKYTLADSGQGYSFAREQPAVPLTTPEFGIASREYPIVFVKQEDGFRPVALLGFAQNENLFVKEDGNWKAEYIPAFIRMYPFVLVRLGSENKMVLGVAENHPGFASEDEGAPLFLENGEPGQLIQDVKKFAERMSGAGEITKRFSEELLNANILTPINVRLKGPEDTSRAVGGLFVVDRSKLNELDAGTLKSMVTSGTLEAIFLHLSSLPNLRRLSKRLGHEVNLPEGSDEPDLTS